MTDARATLDAVDGGELVGRDRERARIDELLAGAVAGQSASLLVRGEAGIGKTALLRYATRSAPGFAVLETRGVESESQLPFAALCDLVRPVLDRLAAIPERQAAALAGALALGPPVTSDPFPACAATLSLLAAAAEEKPLLAVVDDAQWIDPSSQQAILFAARRLGAEGVALLLAVREGEGEGFPANDLPELRLTGLHADAAEALLARRLDRSLPPAAL
jgi:predicted ATPase